MEIMLLMQYFSFDLTFVIKVKQMLGTSKDFFLNKMNAFISQGCLKLI